MSAAPIPVLATPLLTQFLGSGSDPRGPSIDLIFGASDGRAFKITITAYLLPLVTSAILDEALKLSAGVADEASVAHGLQAGAAYAGMDGKGNPVLMVDFGGGSVLPILFDKATVGQAAAALEELRQATDQKAKH